MKVFRTLLIGLLFFPLIINAKIVEIQNFHEILKEVDEKSTFFFDIDDTLLTIDGMSLGTTAFWKHYAAKVSFKEDKPKYYPIIKKLMCDLPFKTMEEDTCEVFDKVKAKAQGVFGLTARLRRAEYLPNAAEVISERLLGKGISFTNIMVEDVDPIYYEGILFSNFGKKGPILTLFLEKAGLKPQKILMVDDDLKQLESIDVSLEELGIPFIGFHYLKGVEHHQQFDENKAFIQLEQFLRGNPVSRDEEIGNF